MLRQVDDFHEVLLVQQMYEADRLAMEAGVSGPALMEKAGSAVARAIALRWSARPALIACGKGNNGGDGFVAARHLHNAGWPVTVALLGGDRGALKGDAAWAAGQWNGPVVPLEKGLLPDAEIVVDAIFGAGLNAPVSLDFIAALAEGAPGRRIVAVDVPSGLDGDTGQIRGVAAAADLTVSFFRPKPGHLLQPGRKLCGETLIADIGTPTGVLDRIAAAQFVNGPAAWKSGLTRPMHGDHKYTRGHVAVFGGIMPGAGRLAAAAAARSGAGMVTLLSDSRPTGVLPAAVILRGMPEDPAAFFHARKVRACLIGPGLGLNDADWQAVSHVLAADLPTVLDADALTLLSRRQDAMPDRTAALILTPHQGEAARLLPELAGADKLTTARAIAARYNSVCVLKGSDTVIADSDGRASLAADVPPALASAGTGDVLAGLITGILAQGADAWSAAGMAVHAHARAGAALGWPLIADDMIAILPAQMRQLPEN